MKTTDWEFDFSSLPHWDNRDRIPYVHDEFVHIPQSDTLCCIYSIAEVRMGWDLGFLAILANKENPSLILNITEHVNFFPNVSVNTKGNLIFLQALIYNKKSELLKCPVVVIDISNNTFSYIDTVNCNTCYKIVEISENVFKIAADEYQMKHDKRLKALSRKKIRTDRLKWHSLNELESLPKIIF